MLRLAARSSAGVLMRPWSVGLLLLMLPMAWSASDSWMITESGVSLRPSVWDALQSLFSGVWGLIYVVAVPCALFGVALTVGARNSGWSALTAPRVGGLAAYARANLIAGVMVTVMVIAVFALVAVAVAAVRGGSFAGGPAASTLAELALDQAYSRRYTVVPDLGAGGSLALAVAAFTLVSFAAMLVGQWIGTIYRRPAVAAALSAALLILTAQILGPGLPDGLRQRIDPWIRIKLDNYTGFRGPGGISIAWAFAVPLLLIVVLTTATWWATRRRGVARSDE